MSDIFISYAHQDRAAAQSLAQHLGGHSWSVWWDREIGAGETFDEVIEEAMRGSRCVLVLWSKHSASSRWVRAEAEEGAKRHILVPILLEEVEIPMAFRQIQAADLTAWDGSEEALAGQGLARDVRRVLEPAAEAPRPDPLAPPHSRSRVAPMSTRRPPRTLRKLSLTGLGLLVVAVLAVMLATNKLWRSTDGSATTGPLITSLAVLPLENLSGDPAQDYYSDGLTEALIADLGRISALRVISRQSVMRYKDSDKPLPQIAEELGVEALIEGSVLPAGGRVRVTAQLVQARPEQHLWADSYERDASDVLALLSEVTRAITAEVRVTVSPEEEVLLAAARRVDPDAHRAYLRGMNAFRRGTPADVTKAAEYFRMAVQIDPSYALAWAGLAGYHLSLEIWALPLGAEDIRRMSALEADAALERALDLDDSSSQAHMYMGWVEFWRNWDWPRADNEFLRAIELSPNDPDIRLWYARFLSAMGRHEEAAAENRLAEELDPLSALVHRAWGDLYYFARDFEASLRSYERSLELDPEHLYALGMMGFPLTAMGRREEAAKNWQAYRVSLGQRELARSMEGKTFEDVNRLWLRAAKDPTHPNSGPGLFAVTHAMIGEYEEALSWLEQGYATREDPGKTAGWIFPWLNVEPLYEPLHSDPRFQDLLRRMNLAD